MINNIIRGNCVDIMKNIPSNKIDLVITSPPYDQIRDYNDYEINLHEIGNEIHRVLKDGGVACVIINDGTKNFRKSLTSFRLVIDWVNLGLNLFETVIYNRHGRPGAWWNKRFRVDHEYIFIFFKGNKPKHFDKSKLMIDAIHAGETWHGTQRLTNGDLIPIKKKKQKAKKCRGTIWHYKTSNTEGNKKKMLHPATFPDLLAEDLIMCFSKEQDIVLDPMCGSGTTCRMAKKNKRKYIGIDISQEYCELARELLENE